MNARKHPSSILPDVKSLIMLGVSYDTVLKERPLCESDSGLIVAKYARGIDYHLWIRPKLRHLANELKSVFPDCSVRGVVDTAPLLERHYALNAGLGWVGKNTMLTSEKYGSRFFIAALLCSVPFSAFGIPKADAKTSKCGNCRKCIDACPTGALTEYSLDARKCISYWTIETDEPFPEFIREKIGNRIFGCDSCQDACPYNSAEDKTSGRIEIPKTEAEFEEKYGETPLKRAGLKRLSRNSTLPRSF